MTVHAARAVVLLALAACAPGPPARLTAGTSDTVIVNNNRPVQLPIQVLDAAGHVMRLSGVRYQRMAGDVVPMSPAGEVTCAQRGDAQVRATLGALSKMFFVRCRPIRGFVKRWDVLRLAVGDSAQQLQVEAIGIDGKPETLLAGLATVQDGEIASLNGMSVLPKKAGETGVAVRIGDVGAVFPVSVYARARSSDAMRPYQQFVVAPLRLANGETRRWPLAPGAYFLSLMPHTGAHTELTLATDGSSCIPFGEGQSFFCVFPKPATVVVYAPRTPGRAQELSGGLSVRRQY